MALARPAEREVTRGPATLMDAFLAERARPSEGQSAAGTSEGFGYLLIRSLDPQSVRTEIGQRSGATGAAALHAEETKGYHTGGLVARAAVIPLGSGRRLDHRMGSSAYGEYTYAELEREPTGWDKDPVP